MPAPPSHASVVIIGGVGCKCRSVPLEERLEAIQFRPKSGSASRPNPCRSCSRLCLPPCAIRRGALGPADPARSGPFPSCRTRRDGRHRRHLPGRLPSSAVRPRNPERGAPSRPIPANPGGTTRRQGLRNRRYRRQTPQAGGGRSGSERSGLAGPQKHLSLGDDAHSWDAGRLYRDPGSAGNCWIELP